MKRAISLLSGLSIAASMSALPAFAESYSQRTSESYLIIDGEVIEHTVNDTVSDLTLDAPLSIEAELDASQDAALMDDMIEVTIEEENDDIDEETDVIELEDADDDMDEDMDDEEDRDEDDEDAPLLTNEHAAVLQAAFDRASAAQSIEELQTVMTEILNTLNMIHAQQ